MLYSIFAESSFLEGGVIYTKMSMIFWDLSQVSRHRDSMVLMPRKQTHELLGWFGEHRNTFQRETRPSVDWDPWADALERGLFQDDRHGSKMI